MDNAKDQSQVRPLIPPAGCALLVTSRIHFYLPGLYAKDLEALPQQHAEVLVKKIVPRIGNHAGNIARSCSYLPLALRLAASALAERRDLDPAKYALNLGDEKQRLKLLTGKDDRGKDYSVEASIGMSYSLLDEETQKRWRMLSVFPDTFDALAVAAVWGLGTDGAAETAPNEARDTLSQLLQYSLLEWNESARRYRLHDLMRDFARKRLDDAEREEAARRHAGHYVDVLWKTDALYKAGGDSILRGWALFDLEWGNIRAGQAWAAAHAADEAANDATDDREAAKLASAYPGVGVYCLDLRQHPREQIRWLEAALSAARRLKDRRGEGNALANMSLALDELGDRKQAIEHAEAALKIYEQIEDPNAGEVRAQIEEWKKGKEDSDK